MIVTVMFHQSKSQSQHSTAIQNVWHKYLNSHETGNKINHKTLSIIIVSLYISPLRPTSQGHTGGWMAVPVCDLVTILRGVATTLGAGGSAGGSSAGGL